MSEQVRHFASGATRDGKEGKINPEGALSPIVLRRFAQYMLEKQKLPDGSLRGADNWQLGIPRQAYMESICRHWLELWEDFRDEDSDEELEEDLCAMFFNTQGLLFEVLKRRSVKDNTPCCALGGEDNCHELTCSKLKEDCKLPTSVPNQMHVDLQKVVAIEIPYPQAHGKTLQGLNGYIQETPSGRVYMGAPTVSEIQFPSQGQANSHGQVKPDIHGGQVEGPTKLGIVESFVKGYNEAVNPEDPLGIRADMRMGSVESSSLQSGRAKCGCCSLP